MREKLLKKIKQNKAFTLTELLITVAILTVLMGVSMLYISDWASHLNMMELDGYAKTIYLEMQNQLAAKEVEGGLVELYEDIHTNTPDRFLTTQPQDYDVDEQGDNWKLLCYIEKEDGVTKTMIPESSSTYMIGGNYIAEINPRSGDVYGVFYWEDGNAIDYDVIKSLSARTMDAREDLRIGYYGGNAESRELSRGMTLDQTVELINEEELYLRVVYEKTGQILANQDAISIDLSIADEHGNVWRKDDVEATKKQEADGLAFYILLDSMQSGRSFKDITEGVLVPGDNITVTVEGEFLKNFYHCIEISKVKGNSLFDDKSGSTIYVDTLRHFRNLDSTYYHHQDVTTGETIQIIQNNDIDYENNNYAWAGNDYVGKGSGSNPLSGDFKPLTNSDIFSNTGVGTDYTVYDGNGFELKNFKITSIGTGLFSTPNAGMFATAKHTHFKNVKIEDLTLNASGKQNVGGLVGSIEGGSVIDCGIYLKNYTGEETSKSYCVNQEANDKEKYGNRMQEKVATMTVTGGTNVGGLIGSADGTNIQMSFAAVKVQGTTNAGGFIGNAKNIAMIERCYSSGDVIADTNVGGFIGNAQNITSVFFSYSTSDASGTTNVGGFLGTSTNSAYDNCYSCGAVLEKSDNKAPVNGTGGGFVYAGASSGNAYSGCRYLKQKAYNAIGLTDPSGKGVSLLALGYSNLYPLPDDVIASGKTFAYDDKLVYESYPFIPVTGSHYGDWPLQNAFNNSLVYYEKYDDGSYGYYSVTTLDDSSKDYIWVLDTLRDETCVEDGYALLCTYNLTRFSYDLHIGSGSTSSQTGTLTVSTEYASDEATAKKQAVRLRQQGELEFKGYEDQAEYYDPATSKETISVTGMYLYQLPYELQCTARTQVENFYDRLILYDGYAKGNDGEGATPVLGGTTAGAGVSYFYCPHFAKTAVNPGTDGADQNELLNPARVYVRSARQLNALGRYSYYWNKKQGMADKLNFVQETDINFSTYTDGTKLYCGHSFDLMDVDSAVANQPIGDPNFSYKPAQFQNNYDGQCNEIRNYCVKSSKQFVGLFGEILNAKIENIVMVADEGKGKIICQYEEKRTQDRAGAGALVGLAYKYGTDKNLIKNCVSAGYTVEFIRNNEDIGRVAVGGLVGFSMTDMENCAAVNDVIFTQPSGVDNSNGKTFIAGLVGSSLYGSLQNAYAGGTITIDVNGNEVGFINVAGVTAGGMWIDGCDYEGSNNQHTTTIYRNLYSYTTVITEKDHVEVSDYYVLSSAVGNLYKDSSGYYIRFDGVRAMEDGTASECYYLQDSISPKIYKKNAWWYTKSDNKYDFGASKNYADLSTITAGTLGNRAVATYPTTATLRGKSYPFPAVITDANGNYVHYGDWPLATGDTSLDEEEITGEKMEGSGFQIELNDELKDVELYRTKEGDSYTYYFEFSFTADELYDEDGDLVDDHLYVVAPIPDLYDEVGIDKQVYLTFEDNGTCDATHTTDSPNKVKDGAKNLVANKTYIFYILNVKINPDTGKPYSGEWHDDNSPIMWAIMEK